jgi:signal transduction histidine kinase/ActR/RegA family two-component response regulator
MTGLLTVGAVAGARSTRAAPPAAGLPLTVHADRSLPPYSFLDNGQPSGAHVDLFKALAQEMGRTLDMRLGDWAEAQAAVLRGDGDVLPPIASTAERARHFAFTQAVGRNEFGLFARDDAVARVARSRAEELTIGVTAGGYARLHFESRHPGVRLAIVQDTVDGLRRVQLGQIDAVAGNVATTRSFLRDLRIGGITLATTPFAVLDVAIAVHRRNPALLTELDEAIDRLRGRGELKRIESRWFDAPPVTLDRTQLWALAGGAAGLALVAGLGSALFVQRQRLKERDAEIARRRDIEARLEAARAAAESAARVKADFLANMSHEIRTPMNAIVGMSRLLREGGGSAPDTHQRLRRLDEAAKHLLAMVSDVLDMSKIEAGKLEIEDIPFDLPALMESVRSNVGGLADHKGLSLQIEYDAGVRRLVGDPTRLRQAILNLVSNAIKFTDEGHVRLTAQVVDTEAAATTLRFQVEDTGRGISPDLQGRLFRPFEQEDGSMMRQYGGTGLGLSITKRLVEMMGGEIGCQSTPGQGSLFWFTVRLKPMASRALEAPPSDAHDAAAQLRTRHPGARIVLADDNEVNLEVTRHALLAAGLNVIEARDGEEAVSQVSSSRAQMVLMDVRMPRMDGIQATIALRQLFPPETLPIVALTANAFEEDRRECLMAGMNGFLTKPVDPTLLYQSVLHWLDRAARG